MQKKYIVEYEYKGITLYEEVTAVNEEDAHEMAQELWMERAIRDADYGVVCEADEDSLYEYGLAEEPHWDEDEDPTDEDPGWDAYVDLEETFQWE